MLVLTRKVGETIVIAGDIEVTVTAVQGRKVRLGVKAPAGAHIARSELLEEFAGAAAGDDFRRKPR